MFAILKCCAWVQIVKQTCPRLKTSPQPVRQLSPNLYLMGKYEDLVESESGGGDHAMQHTPHTHWLSGHSNTTNVRDKYSWQWPELLIIYIMYF